MWDIQGQVWGIMVPNFGICSKYYIPVPVPKIPTKLVPFLARVHLEDAVFLEVPSLKGLLEQPSLATWGKVFYKSGLLLGVKVYWNA